LLRVSIYVNLRALYPDLEQGVSKRAAEYTGRHYTIRCLELADGTCPVGEFLDALDPKERRKLDVLFEMLGEQGKISNREKFKRLVDSENIWEFKSFQIRILCFFDRNRVVLLAHPTRKKTNKLSKEDIKRAEDRRRWYLSKEKLG
jgi:mRNA-degrading endonuclease RelE of RelBE toxin-antitoxin system